VDGTAASMMSDDEADQHGDEEDRADPAH
jgi:hypothetical protein